MSRWIRWWLAVAVLVAVLPAHRVGAAPVAAGEAPEYVVGEGDVLAVSVWGVKDFETVVKVRPDGKITVPAVGDVSAGGMTPTQLRLQLTERVAALVKNPVVTVAVKEVTNSKVYVFGGGVNSAIYNLDRRTTLLQLLCQIGSPHGEKSAGVPASTDFRRAYLLRNGQKIKENFHDLFIKGKVEEDVVIQANDVVFIPEAAEKYVYVTGAVNAPRVLEFREGMTVMQAILEAGGYSKFASENDTLIVRKGAEKTEI
ncbi:MAG TPA: polysaccharide biosynthesis/export family protein, partial [Verrucomicrobiae bacterium]|nr:polysaccharide biosynthesis/export family protein [Verrucomicrobiae bacterium]